MEITTTKADLVAELSNHPAVYTVVEKTNRTLKGFTDFTYLYGIINLEDNSVTEREVKIRQDNEQEIALWVNGQPNILRAEKLQTVDKGAENTLIETAFPTFIEYEVRDNLEDFTVKYTNATEQLVQSSGKIVNGVVYEDTEKKTYDKR